MADSVVESKTADTSDNTDNTSILERLQQYGESWLDDDDYQRFVRTAHSKARKAIKSHRGNGASGEMTDSTTDTAMSRRQKKKLKRKILQHSNDGTSETNIDNTNSTNVSRKRKRNRHIDELKSELNLEQNLCKSKEKTVLPKNARNHSVITPSEADSKLFVFADPAKRKRKKDPVVSPPSDIPPTDSRLEPSQPEMNLREARHDVKMFGIKGFQGKRKETAVTDMLMKLGAKPPKNTFYNYKQFMEIRKQEIRENKDRQEMGRQFGFKNSKGDKRRPNRKNTIGHVDGQIGSYRSGVQVLRRDDIQRVKQSKVKK